MMSTSLDTWLIVIFYILDTKISYSKRIISFLRCYCISSYFFYQWGSSSIEGLTGYASSGQQVWLIVGHLGFRGNLLAVTPTDHWIDLNGVWQKRAL